MSKRAAVAVTAGWMSMMLDTGCSSCRAGVRADLIGILDAGYWMLVL
jgi:hypothetical protein